MTYELPVIPHYNDSDRLRPFLNKLSEILHSHYSILLSDNGSKALAVAAFPGRITEVRATFQPLHANLLEPLFFHPNSGKEGAVIREWEQGNGCKLVAFVGAVGASEIIRGKNLMRPPESYDALFGRRLKMLGRGIHRSPFRHATGRVFSTLVSMVSGLSDYDTRCGLKILKSEVFCEVRRYIRGVGFTFNAELCLLLQKFEGRMEELLPDWMDGAGSKVRLMSDSLPIGMEVYRTQRLTSGINF